MTSERRTITDTIPDALDAERIDRVVAMVADVPRTEAAALVDGGHVRLDGETVTKRSLKVTVGDEVSVDVHDKVEAGPLEGDDAVPFSVVHEDADVLVVDKPAGVVVHPGSGNLEGTLVHGLLARYPELADVGEPNRPGIVHRLDKDTSGLLVVARTDDARDLLIDALSRRAVTRRYHTLVKGHVESSQGMIDAPLGRSTREPTKMAVVVGGREARTRYEVVRRFDEPRPFTELVCHLETGRTHQIRVHLQGIGHAVAGDSRYGGTVRRIPLHRQFLHAEHLAFRHPTTGVAVAFDSPLPDDLRTALAALS